MKNKNYLILLITSLMFNFTILTIMENGILTPNENSKIIELKIKNNFFPYKKQTNNRDYNDYDFYLLNKQYDLKHIYFLIKNRKESRFYSFLSFMYEDNNHFLSLSDNEIIDILKFLIARDDFITEIKKSPKFIQILERIKKINNNSIYLNIFKEKILEVFLWKNL